MIAILIFSVMACQEPKAIIHSKAETTIKDTLSAFENAISAKNEIIELYRNDSTVFFIYMDNICKIIEMKSGESISTTGNLNYERGFGNDIDATIYILDFDKIGKERYFVRLTKDNSTLLALD